jgi:hypothetical protein
MTEQANAPHYQNLIEIFPRISTEIIFSLEKFNGMIIESDNS